MQKTNFLMNVLVVFWVLVFIHTNHVQAQEINTLDIFPSYNQQNTVSLTFDDKEALLNVKLFINHAGQSMILTDELAALLELQLDWVDNNQLQLTRGDKMVSFRANEYYYLRNDDIITMETSPLKSNAGIFIPLRQTAEEFGMTVKYNADTRTVMLYSQPPKTDEKEPDLTIDFPQNLGRWGEITPDSELAQLWRDHKLFGGYYTNLNNSPPNRTNNIILACREINGHVLKPGEIFTFNGQVGQRTTEKGYLSASIFVGREVVPGIGGGICQLSSTLYNAALETGLEIVERHPHTLPVSYIAAGRDATILWGGADFKFRNNQDFNLKVLTDVYGNYVVALLAIE